MSDDGSRVFFSAVPGTDCSQASHLYMRVNGGERDSETVDIGPYGFLAANHAGTEVLLEAHNGDNEEVLLYDTASATSKTLFTLHEHLAELRRCICGSLKIFRRSISNLVKR